jgi:hypothetical protein
MQQLRLDSNRHIAYWTNERSTFGVDYNTESRMENIPLFAIESLFK